MPVPSSWGAQSSQVPAAASEGSCHSTRLHQPALPCPPSYGQRSRALSPLWQGSNLAGVRLPAGETGTVSWGPEGGPLLPSSPCGQHPLHALSMPTCPSLRHRFLYLLAPPPGPFPVPPSPLPTALLPCCLPEPSPGLSGEAGLLPAQGEPVLINLWQFRQSLLLASGWIRQSKRGEIGGEFPGKVPLFLKQGSPGMKEENDGPAGPKRERNPVPKVPELLNPPGLGPTCF